MVVLVTSPTQLRRLQVKALQEAAPSQIQDIRTADDISVAFEVGI